MTDLVLMAVTFVSVGLAAVMGVITWRVLRLERLRTAARVAVLTEAAYHDASGDPPERPAPALERVASDFPIAAEPDSAVSPSMFAPQPSTSGSRYIVGLASAVGLLVLVAVGWRLSGPGPVPPADIVSATAGPIELLSLGHARDGGQLAIRGVVRNPAAADAVRGLVAVAYVFDKSGAYLGASRAAVLEPVLLPGGESPFDVPVADGRNVVRYRLSFQIRTAPVPHVDRRKPTVVGAASNRLALDTRAAAAAAGR